MSYPAKKPPVVPGFSLCHVPQLLACQIIERYSWVLGFGVDGEDRYVIICQDSTFPGYLPAQPALANCRVMSEQLLRLSLTIAAAAFCNSAVEVASDIACHTHIVGLHLNLALNPDIIESSSRI